MKIQWKATFIAFIVTLNIGLDMYAGLAIVITIYLGAGFFDCLSEKLAFTEFLLFLYAINYLFSPAIAYRLSDESLFYQMKVPSQQYFELMIPAFICFYFGINFLKTKIFIPDFTLLKLNAIINELILRQWLFLGVAMFFIKGYLPGELAFFAYLISLIRYVAAFSLFSLDRSKYRWHLILVVSIEAYNSVLQGMFHDTVMWIVFFVLFFSYINRHEFRSKLILMASLLVLFFFVQNVKNEYRSQVWSGNQQAGLGSFAKSSSKVLNTQEGGGILGEENLIGGLTRVNQAWIFASTIENMDRRQDFQGLTLLNRYLEASLLPRILAPNKLKSGEKDIFNTFSGHTIKQGTSMGLGVFADGYIAYGALGVWVFAFGFGLLFSVVFKIVENWSKISPFFILFIFPILNYAVRPDCESQTIINHLFKSMLVFSIFVYLAKRKFSLVVEQG